MDGTCMCPYRVIYYIKCLLYWTESPRDHVDALLSFKYQPTISINMPHMVARHGNLCTYGKCFSHIKIEWQIRVFLICGVRVVVCRVQGIDCGYGALIAGCGSLFAGCRALIAGTGR